MFADYIGMDMILGWNMQVFYYDYSQNFGHLHNMNVNCTENKVFVEHI